MPKHGADATWNGDLQSGNGTMNADSGVLSGASYSFTSRFEGDENTSPEELIGAAHAGCFSMALSNILAEAGYEPESVHTEADVHLEMVDGNPAITRVELQADATVPGIDDETFQQHAEAAKEGCPVSKVLAGAAIELDATLN